MRGYYRPEYFSNRYAKVPLPDEHTKATLKRITILQLVPGQTQRKCTLSQTDMQFLQRPSALCAAGEWSGIAVTYDATGEAQELPYQYVPQAFREWGAVPKDWHTQCSTLADGAGLLTKLKRLYPIVGESSGMPCNWVKQTPPLWSSPVHGPDTYACRRMAESVFEPEAHCCASVEPPLTCAACSNGLKIGRPSYLGWLPDVSVPCAVASQPKQHVRFGTQIYQCASPGATPPRQVCSWNYPQTAIAVIAAGCEADAVAFEEEQRRDFQDPSGAQVEPLGRSYSVWRLSTDFGSAMPSVCCARDARPKAAGCRRCRCSCHLGSCKAGVGAPSLGVSAL